MGNQELQDRMMSYLFSGDSPVGQYSVVSTKGQGGLFSGRGDAMRREKTNRRTYSKQIDQINRLIS
jgi:hypothetical protein